MPTFAPVQPHRGNAQFTGGNAVATEGPLVPRSSFASPVEQDYLRFLQQATRELGGGWTTSDAIERYGHRHLRTFVGCFPYDKLPDLKDGQSCVVNQDRAGGSGIHWFAVCKVGGVLYGYDSFGRPMDKYIARPVRNDTHDREQLTRENNCGARACAFLHCYEKYGIHQALQV